MTVVLTLLHIPHRYDEFMDLIKSCFPIGEKNPRRSLKGIKKRIEGMRKNERDESKLRGYWSYKN